MTHPEKINTDSWIEIKLIVEPEEYRFLQKQAQRKDMMVSDLIRQIVLRYIGNERGSL